MSQMLKNFEKDAEFMISSNNIDATDDISYEPPDFTKEKPSIKGGSEHYGVIGLMIILIILLISIVALKGILGDVVFVLCILASIIVFVKIKT